LLKGIVGFFDNIPMLIKNQREEVATIAGIGVTMYTRLKQGEQYASLLRLLKACPEL
jgi:hypothetical protein